MSRSERVWAKLDNDYKSGDIIKALEVPEKNHTYCAEYYGGSLIHHPPNSFPILVGIGLTQDHKICKQGTTNPSKTPAETRQSIKFQEISNTLGWLHEQIGNTFYNLF